ncbi:MAG: hypothetical protein ACKVE4_11680 [Dissulfuribacterales bacterium]
MALEHRLKKLEDQFKTDAKYSGCELEINIDAEGEPARYFCRYPDGRKELITDSRIINELEDIPGDEISVEIVD